MQYIVPKVVASHRVNGKQVARVSLDMTVEDYERFYKATSGVARRALDDAADREVKRMAAEAMRDADKTPAKAPAKAVKAPASKPARRTSKQAPAKAAAKANKFDAIALDVIAAEDAKDAKRKRAA